MTENRADKIAARFTTSEKRKLERSGAAMWANVLAHVTAAAFSRSETVSRDELIAALEAWAKDRDELTKAGSDEAIKRLRQTIPKGHDEKG